MKTIFMLVWFSFERNCFILFFSWEDSQIVKSLPKICIRLSFYAKLFSSCVSFVKFSVLTHIIHPFLVRKERFTFIKVWNELFEFSDNSFWCSKIPVGVDKVYQNQNSIEGKLSQRITRLFSSISFVVRITSSSHFHSKLRHLYQNHNCQSLIVKNLFDKLLQCVDIFIAEISGSNFNL